MSENPPPKIALKDQRLRGQAVSPSLGASGVFRLLLALIILAANIGLYTILPIASLGLLPMLLAAICLLSGTLDDLGMHR